MTRQVSAWWPIVTSLAGALMGFGVASFHAGRQLAVLDDIRPALAQLAVHERKLTVAGVTCCPAIHDLAFGNPSPQLTTALSAAGLR